MRPDMTTLHLGDCREVMAGMEADQFDSIVTDPPYGLAFMGKDWDHGVPGVAFWQEALRVAKPGAHLLAFGGTRTFHRLAVAIEDAGWEIRDTVMWVYGSGFPKSLDVSKSIDKAAGAERNGAVPGGHMGHATSAGDGANANELRTSVPHSVNKGAHTRGIPATPEAERWTGWGTALKPAWEPIIVARKPLRGTVAANVLALGTGAINVDGCRVATNGAGDYDHWREPDNIAAHNGFEGKSFAMGKRSMPEPHAQGRWPANLLHDGSDEVVGLFPVSSNGHFPNGGKRTGTKTTGIYGSFSGAETPERYTGDTGSAARFFYCAKASKADRDEGCEGLGAVRRGSMVGNVNDCDFLTGAGNPRQSTGRNHHPTVKPTALMRWLVRLITPPGGVVLDPFMGSGSTGKAAALEGMAFVGIERDAEYLEIARRRIEAVRQPMLPGLNGTTQHAEQVTLWPE